MKTTIGQVLQSIKRGVLAFLPSIIAIGITIFLVLHFDLLPAQPQPIQVTGQQAPTNSEFLDVIARVSEKAMQTSSNTVEMMKWVVATFFGLAVSGVALFWRTEREVTQKITQIQRDYNLVGETLVNTENKLSDLSVRYLNIQQNLYDLPSRILPYEMAIAAFEAGKITEVELLESQAWFSWQKWAFADNPTGYEELLAHKESREGLPGSVVMTAITVLTGLIEKKRKPGAFTRHDEDKMNKLVLLLNLETQP